MFVSNQHTHLQGNHWSILTLPLFEGPPCHWDSVTSTEPSMSHTCQKMKSLYKEATVQLQTRIWPDTDCLKFRSIYEQSNSFDCGIYSWLHACKFNCDLEKKPFPFLDETPIELRRTLNSYARVANDILSDRLSP